MEFDEYHCDESLLRPQTFDLFEEVEGRLVGDAGPLHLLAQLVGLAVPADALEVIPLEEDHDLVGIVGVAEEVTALRAAGLAVRGVLIEDQIPPFEVLYLV